MVLWIAKWFSFFSLKDVHSKGFLSTPMVEKKNLRKCQNQTKENVTEKRKKAGHLLFGKIVSDVKGNYLFVVLFSVLSFLPRSL